jgi:hypothetical protein
MIPSNDNERKGTMNSGIRRQLGTEANRRYLHELPIFRVEPILPSNFDVLLDELDRAERRRVGRKD